MPNPHLLIFTSKNRGKKPKLAENEKSITFSTTYTESMYKWVMAHGGGTYIRKLVYGDMPEIPKIAEA